MASDFTTEYLYVPHALTVTPRCMHQKEYVVWWKNLKLNLTWDCPFKSYSFVPAKSWMVGRDGQPFFFSSSLQLVMSLKCKMCIPYIDNFFQNINFSDVRPFINGSIFLNCHTDQVINFVQKISVSGSIAGYWLHNITIEINSFPLTENMYTILSMYYRY